MEFFMDDAYFEEKEISKIKKSLRKNIIGQDAVLEKIDNFID
jgi:hypothetical protein